MTDTEHPRTGGRVLLELDGPGAGGAVRYRAALYGPEFAPSLSGAPASAFVAAGSPVIVRRGVPLEAAA